MSYKIEREFRETQVEKQIAGHLGALSYLMGQQFHLLDSDEETTGADAEMAWKAVAYYFQFKRPEGLKNVSTCPLPPVKRKNEAKTQDIRRVRASEGMLDAPHSLCFPLRKLAKNATEYQHNLLLAHDRPSAGIRAAYVCALELALKSYLAASSGGIHLCPPFSPICWHDVTMLDSPDAVRWVAQVVKDVPAFRAHVAIPPHKRVSTHEHYYSFSTQGDDVVFHSDPERLDRGGSRFSEFLYQTLSTTAERSRELPTVATLRDRIATAAESWLEPLGMRAPTRGDERGWLSAYGRALYRVHGIHQFIFVFPGDAMDGGSGVSRSSRR